MYVVFIMGNSFPGWINGISEITATTYKVSLILYRCKREIGPPRVFLTPRPGRENPPKFAAPPR